jgi:hypothetical protein
MAIRTTVRAAAVGAAALACAALVVPVANASGTPQVSVSCESGASKFICFGTITGGTTPYTVTWTVNGAPYPGGNLVHGPCSVPGVINAQLTVRDSTGATASGTGGVSCSNNAWA